MGKGTQGTWNYHSSLYRIAISALRLRRITDRINLGYYFVHLLQVGKSVINYREGTESGPHGCRAD